ncbi:MAG: MFS transporter [Gemmatimonadales bacterium]
MPHRSRIKWTLFATQSFGSAGFLISSTIAPILGASLSGHPGWAGVPAAFYWGGGSGFAFVWGRLMERLGRRRTLMLGLTAGFVGAAIASTAVAAGLFWVFVAGLALLGGANNAVQQSRFVAAEVHPRPERGRAIATVVLGGTVGGILGPLCVAPMSRLAESIGTADLSGPYWASVVFFAIGFVVVALGLRPEPRDLAMALEAETTGAAGVAHPVRPVREILGDRLVLAAIVSMVLAQGLMSTLMVISSLHMRDHAHSLGRISVAFSTHVVGMFGLSMVTGRLADRWGRGRLIVTGAVILVGAGLGAVGAVRFLPVTAVLFFLGLGWNCCFVGGSTLLSDRLTQLERAGIQGFNDSLLAAASATGSLLSGIAYGAVGYSFIGGLVATLALIPLALGWRYRERGGASPASAAA